MQAKNIVITVLALVILGAVVYLFLHSSKDTVVIVEDTSDTTQVEERLSTESNDSIGDSAEPIEVTPTKRSDETTLGSSVAGKAITAYHFGSGEKEILFVGGVHGGYSPNTTALTNQLVSYFKNNESEIPDNLMVTIIPTLNPDGAAKSGATGRFNAHEVDLNRNFDCEWSADAVWQSQKVSGGSEPFSEPEAAALRDYVLTYDPVAAIVYFSAEGKVYPSACGSTPDKSSVTLAATYATAANYPAAAAFDAYAITGDMVNWMAKQDVPAISVLLSDHQNTEWNKNLAGVRAVLNAYAE